MGCTWTLIPREEVVDVAAAGRDGGRAVWCHHALPLEAALDRNDGVSPTWTGWSQQANRARREIEIADQLLQ
ncbi:MAG: hypothetical protein ACYC1D_01510, partial [Acidimicrobiales bacterium]